MQGGCKWALDEWAHGSHNTNMQRDAKESRTPRTFGCTEQDEISLLCEKRVGVLNYVKKKNLQVSHEEVQEPIEIITMRQMFRVKGR